MKNYVEVKCPHCKIVLIIDSITGQVAETREPLVKDSSGDRFKDALKKVKESPKETEEKFMQSKQAEKNKQKNLDELFKKSLDQVKKSGQTKPDFKDIDLD